MVKALLIFAGLLLGIVLGARGRRLYSFATPFASLTSFCLVVIPAALLLCLINRLLPAHLAAYSWAGNGQMLLKGAVFGFIVAVFFL